MSARGEHGGGVEGRVTRSQAAHHAGPCDAKVRRLAPAAAWSSRGAYAALARFRRQAAGAAGDARPWRASARRSRTSPTEREAERQAARREAARCAQLPPLSKGRSDGRPASGRGQAGSGRGRRSYPPFHARGGSGWRAARAALLPLPPPSHLCLSRLLARRVATRYLGAARPSGQPCRSRGDARGRSRPHP